ncbi:MAG: catalase HPII [Betaproteobacteria bacterium]
MATNRRDFLKAASTSGLAVGLGTTDGVLTTVAAADTDAAAASKPNVAGDATSPTKAADLDPNRSDSADQFLTTNQGVKIEDDHNTLKAGARGPSLLEDFQFREKITHFDHERIPERVVHARGSAAHGYFQVYKSMAQYTKARFLQDPAVKTPVFVRFSTVAGSRGSADTARDVRGFAVKFYTEDGNFDLVGNNMPVFFIQDAIQFPDLIHAAKPEQHNEIPQAATAHSTFWDFISLTPESMHMIMWVMSDRALPRSYRMMEGFGVHTFRFVNAQNVSHFVKFHWKPLLGVHSLVWDEAQKLAGKDPDFHRRDLWEAIDAGDFAEWEFGVQIFTEADAAKFDFDVLDATKLIPEELVPVTRIGKMTLNRNPDNFFAETEQVAFHTGHIVPGLDFSDDPLLQGRLFSYLDTQITRLGGPNFHQIPINRAICPFHNNQRDGMHQQSVPKGRSAHEPNSLAGGSPRQATAAQGGFVSYPEKINAVKIKARADSFSDHFSQATLFWNSQAPHEQDHIVDALRFELSKVDVAEVRQRMLGLLATVDMDLATRVAAGLGAQVKASDAKPNQHKSSVAKSTALSMANTVKNTIKSRKIAILAADGVDAQAVQGMKAALEAAGAQAKIVAPHLGTIVGSDGKPIPVDFTITNKPSVEFDALYVPGGEQSVAALRGSGDALHYIMEAFKHNKAIAVTGDAAHLLGGAGLMSKPGGATGLPLGVVAASSDTPIASVAKDFIAAIAQHRAWARKAEHSIPA